MSFTTDHRDRTILATLRSCSKRYGGGWFYQKHWKIAERARCSVSTLQRALARLIEAGYVIVRQRWLEMAHGGKMMLACEYLVADREPGQDRSVKKTDQRASPVYLKDKQTEMSNRWSRLRMLMQPKDDSAATPALLRSLARFSRE